MNVLKSKKEYITLYYGKQALNGSPYNHTGLDIVKSPMSLDYVVACANGKVIKVVSNVKTRDLNKGYGNYVIVDHGNGYSTLYAHLKYATIKVKVGDKVSAGDVLGYMGDTGYTFGAHLHFEVMLDNKCVDPLPYLQDKKSFAVKATTFSAKYKVNTIFGLNIRKEPKITGKKVGAYKNNTVVNVTEIKNNWGKTDKGWISLLYCKKV